MKKQSLFNRLTQKNYVLFIFAVVVSLIIWIYMSFSSPNTNTTITLSDISIKIELSEDARQQGLQAFTTSDPKASVTLSGTRTVLGLVSESDLNVSAATGSINSVGNYTLPVTANKRSTMGNFSVTGCTPSTVNVTVDYFKQREIPIQDGIVFYVEDGYYGSTTLSYNNITVSGPQTDVLSISKVVAKANISSKLKESREVDAKIILLDENDNEISSKFLDMSFESVKATVTVLPEKQLPIEPAFDNKPEGLDITKDMLSVSPSEIMLAGPEDTLKKLSSVKLETIDFTTLSNQKYNFDELGIVIPENCKSISGDTTAKATLDLSAMSSKTFTVDRFTVEGLTSDYTSTVTSKSITVTVIGPKTEIDKLTSSQITAVIDTSTASGKTGSVEMPVTFRFSGVTSCWAYGSYQANITISKK